MSQPPSMPPRCAKCATPALVWNTPSTSSSSAKTMTNTRAGIGIGGEKNSTRRGGGRRGKAEHLFDLGTGIADELLPVRGLGFHFRFERRGRRGRRGVHALDGDLVPHLGLGESLRHRGVQALHDRRRRAGRDEKTEEEG